MPKKEKRERAGQWRLGAILAVALCVGVVSHGVHAAAPAIAWHLVAQFPHSTAAFTEGLAICRGNLVESDGLYGHSQIEIRTLHTGRLLARHPLARDDFGEGTTCVDGRIFQLTWREHVAFAYDASLTVLRQYPYPYAGWGLAYDGKRLIASDGTATLHFLDANTLAPTGQVPVHDGKQAVTQLNELEWARGYVWANVWHSNRVARVDATTGEVTGWLNLSSLAARAAKNPRWQGDPENVLNGIAWDAASGHFFVTGKRWPLMFEIALGSARHAGTAQAGRATPQ